jgi:glutaconate CoA-transferase subunit B
VPKVDFVTSPGWGHGPQAGPEWRKAQGLPRGGPEALITSLGLFRFPQGRAKLMQTHPGVSLEQVRENTAWELQSAPTVETTPTPSQQELDIIRRFDPDRYWTG